MYFSDYKRTVYSLSNILETEIKKKIKNHVKSLYLYPEMTTLLIE